MSTLFSNFRVKILDYAGLVAARHSTETADFKFELQYKIYRKYENLNFKTTPEIQKIV